MAKIFYLENELVFAEHPKNPKFKDLTGKIFGRLKIIGLFGFVKGASIWFSRCECGNITKVYGSNVNRGRTVSCGCMFIKAVTKHGHNSGGNSTSEYTAWENMIQRTQNPNHQEFKNYGARGIQVCERWRKFENFLADMGEKPDGLSLDRKENDLGYFKENCRWATTKEQCNNTRRNVYLTHNGQTKTLTQWADVIGIKANTLFGRIFRRGWSIEKALTTPPKNVIIHESTRKIQAPRSRQSHPERPRRLARTEKTAQVTKAAFQAVERKNLP